MKIAIIVNFFPPKNLGGTEIASYNLAKHLTKRGHEIHIITSYDEGMPKFGNVQGFYVHKINSSRARVIGVLSFWLKIFLKIREIKPDILHAQDLSMSLPAYLSRKILKIPYVVWGRGTDVYHPRNFERFTMKPILRNAHAILALTEDMREKLKCIYDTRIYVIPNGIDLEEYKDVMIIPNRKKGTKEILFVGRLHPIKGVQYLLRAMKQVQEKIPDARLILVGDGEERERLVSLSIQLGIQKYVQFIGITPHNVVKTFMQQADVFVLPSLSEGFPNVILEAMACGLPIIASRVGGIPDIITNDTNGYLVEVKDTNDMANKILLLLSDDALRKKLSDTNRHQIEKYSWENVISELEKIYDLSIS
jgi:glycosyltransferase involved in cell wall biosynthesis